MRNWKRRSTLWVGWVIYGLGGGILIISLLWALFGGGDWRTAAQAVLQSGALLLIGGGRMTDY